LRRLVVPSLPHPDNPVPLLKDQIRLHIGGAVGWRSDNEL
jgi:hypothetical protein